uniref:Complement component C8 beta chain n=1 Tax=Lygus hesperus TaxID=30085 RepID=A0A0A9YPT2_LYGHE
MVLRNLGRAGNTPLRVDEGGSEECTVHTSAHELQGARLGYNTGTVQRPVRDQDSGDWSAGPSPRKPVPPTVPSAQQYHGVHEPADFGVRGAGQWVDNSHEQPSVPVLPPQ